MADNENEGSEEDRQQAEEIFNLREEINNLRAKNKTLELKKRESDLALNKIKTELNSLRSIDKLWRDASKKVFLNLQDTAKLLDSQIDQILSNWLVVNKTSDRIERKSRSLQQVKTIIFGLQQKIAKQNESIMGLNGQIRILMADIQEKDKKIARLSDGIEEEVERITQPMREKLADAMIIIMREKANRLQERREIADLWPLDRMMPTILMKYRSLNDNERSRRVNISREKDISLALTLEIKSNVEESRSWETKYDDYGRAFYQHIKTGESCEEPPEILSYKPPQGRDEMGNIIINDDNDINNWLLISDSKGEIYYRHKVSGDISYQPPHIYTRIPPSKTREEVVAESAMVVLDYIKEKVSKHIEIKKKRKLELENPLSAEEKRKKEKRDRQRTPEEIAALGPELTEEGEPLDLSLYEYDIETVEMLAYQLVPGTNKDDKDIEQVRLSRRSFLEGQSIRKFREDLCEGETLFQMDINELSISRLRGIVEELAMIEEHLERKLEKARLNLKEFSFLLTDKLHEENLEKMAILREQKIALDKENKANEKHLRAIQRAKLKQELEESTVTEEEVKAIDEQSLSITDMKATEEKEEDTNRTMEDVPNDSESNNINTGDGDGDEILLDQVKTGPSVDIEESVAEESVLPSEYDLDIEESTAGGEIYTINPDLISDETLQRELLGDKASLLFGDLNFVDSQSDYPNELVSLCKNLINFAIFCGFNNLNISEYPFQANLNYSLVQDVFVGDDNNSNVPTVEDDDWLTCHFFLSCSKESLDSYKSDSMRTFDPKHGLMPIGPMESETIIYQARNLQNSISRNLNHPYTPLTKGALESHLLKSFTIWKNHHLYCDVVRLHVQQTAINEIYSRRPKEEDKMNPNNSFALNEASRRVKIPQVEIEISDIKYIKQEKASSMQEEVCYLSFSLGSWCANTTPLFISQIDLNWFDFTLSGRIGINSIQLDSLEIQVMHEHPENGNIDIVGKANISISRAVGSNFGRKLYFEAKVKTNDEISIGTIIFTVACKLQYNFEVFSCDKQELQNLQVLSVDNNIGDSVSTDFTPFNDISPNKIVEEEAKQFRLLVAEMRGDLLTLSKRLSGDYDEKSFTINPKELKKLPKFENAEKFLGKKLELHLLYTIKTSNEIEECSKSLLESIKTRSEKAEKDLSDVKLKLKRLYDSSEEMQKEVSRITKIANDLRKPIPPPKEPEFPDFPPVPYVPSLPASGGLDSRGKKKKALPATEMKSILEQIETGKLDGLQEFPVAENYFPSQAQGLKIGKAVQARNVVLDQRRQQEELARKKVIELFESENLNWEELDKKRLVDLEKAKKECRRINVKFDAFSERMHRFEKEVEGVELDINSMKDLKILQEKSMDRFKLVRLKLQFEKERQEAYLLGLKRRLLRSIHARRFAHEFPRSASTITEQEQLKQQAEQAMRLLKLEIFECRQLLLQEGVRLRTFFHEEESFLRNELTRVNVSIELLNQRSCFDSVLVRYKYEINNLYLDRERLILAECDKDDVGIDTMDDMGERYLPSKVWNVPNIINCQRIIDLTLAKIKTTEGFCRSTGESQKQLVDVVCAQWGEVYLTTRDSWTEASDYERAQKALADTIQYVTNARAILSNERRNLVMPMEKLQLEANLRAEQMENALLVHEFESKGVKNSSAIILDEVRRHLEEYRIAATTKIDKLESAIIDLSRECQKVREELLAQQLIFDEKSKVLWAFIHTLQTAVQQLSAKMEVIIEERERIVIKSKLIADNTRHSLRIERKHSANLLFIIHSQRGVMRYLSDLVIKLSKEAKQVEAQQKMEKSAMRRDLWEHMFTFSRLCTDVDALFEFFASRLSNLSGARSSINDALSRNNAAMVLAALCKNSRPIIRRCAARALGNMGWNGFVETRILLWDCIMYWKMFKAKVIAKEEEVFKSTLSKYDATGRMEALINMNENDDSQADEFVPSGNLSLRSIIKQRRQWALRAARRIEGPNSANQKLLNIKDGVLQSLLEMCLRKGEVDWEVSRNAALAVSIASFEVDNHYDMTHNKFVMDMILQMCKSSDGEVQTHAAITLANLCHKDVDAQRYIGEQGAIPILIDMLQCPVADVLEAAASALSNLTCYCDKNCKEVLDNHGVHRMVQVMTTAYTENLLDLDQNDEVHANAAEMLANVSRFNTQRSIQYFDANVIDALVLMCASPNKQLKRSISLVLGNISQSEQCRMDIGMKGGIEALILTLEDSDTTIQANSLWALGNLMWHPPNQERAGRFMKDIVPFMIATAYEPVQVNACILLGNMLYYNTTNRVRFLETEGTLETLISFIEKRIQIQIVEASLRSLLSLSYLDSIAMWLGVERDYIPVIISFLLEPHYSRDSMRYSLEILSNLCLHHANRMLIHKYHGIEAVVALHVDADEYIRNLSVRIVEYLGDVTPKEVLARMKSNIPLERMITLASSEDPLIRAVAAEAIGEEIWREPAMQARAQELGAVDSLLAIVKSPNEEIHAFLPALWSLRNLLQDNPNSQMQFGYRDGIAVVGDALRRALAGQYTDQSEKVIEGCLACFLAGISKSERNARRLVMVSLDAVLSVVPSGEKSTNSDNFVTSAIHSEGVRSLAQSLLILLAPFNYVVCRNCNKRQDLKGTSCFFCGHRLLMDSTEGLVEQEKQSGLRYSLSAKDGIASTPWRHGGKSTYSPPRRPTSASETKNIQLAPLRPPVHLRPPK